MNRKTFGDFGEDAAVNLLKEKGYKIITRNFRTRLGEIDVIAKDADVLVFVEVKTRMNKKYGAPVEAVTLRKIERIKKAGYFFLLNHPNMPKKMRVDVVAIEASGGKIHQAEIFKFF